MIKRGQLALLGAVLIVSAIGYFVDMVKSGVNLQFSVLFMIELLILYSVLKNVKLN